LYNVNGSDLVQKTYRKELPEGQGVDDGQDKAHRPRYEQDGRVQALTARIEWNLHYNLILVTQPILISIYSRHFTKKNCLPICVALIAWKK
jgi:hypothetical protein